MLLVASVGRIESLNVRGFKLLGGSIPEHRLADVRFAIPKTKLGMLFAWDFAGWMQNGIKTGAILLAR